MRRRLSIDAPCLAPLVGLVLVALLVSLFTALPLGHLLFHGGATEPQTCPVHLLEGSLLLLFVAILWFVFLFARAQGRIPVVRFIPLPLFFCGFFCHNRAPPHS